MSLSLQEAAADQAAGQGEERLLDLAPPIRPQAQPPEPVPPRHRPLRHPAEHPQPTAVRRPLVGEERLDAAAAPLLPLGLGGRGPAPVQRLGPAPGGPGLPPAGGTASTNGSTGGTSLPLAPVSVAASGRPWASVS